MASETLSFEITGTSTSATKAFKDTAGAAGLASAAAKELNDRLATQSKTAQVSAQATLSMVKADDLLRDAEAELSGAAAEARRELAAQGDAADRAAAQTKLAADAAKTAGASAGSGASGMALLVAGALAVGPGLAVATVAMGAFGALAIPTLKQALAGTGPLASGVHDLKGEYDSLAASVRPQVVSDFSHAIDDARRILPEFSGVAHAGGVAVDDLLGQFTGFATSPSTRQFLAFITAQAGPEAQAAGQAVTGLAHGVEGLVQALAPLAKDILPVVGDVGNFIGAFAQGNPVLVQAGFSATAIALAFGKVRDLAITSAVIQGVKDFTTATEGATFAERGLLAAEVAVDAISPLGWVTLAGAGLAALAYAAYKTAPALVDVTGAQDKFIAGLEKTAGATGYNIEAYQRVAGAQESASQGYVAAAAAAKKAGDMQAYYSDILSAGLAAGNASKVSAQAQALAGNLDTVSSHFGITQTAAEQLASAAGVTAADLEKSGSAGKDAASKVIAYADAVNKANNPTSALGQDIATLDNNMLSATTQLNAFNSLWNIFVGNSVSDQAAVQADATAFDSLQKAIKTSGAGSDQAKSAFSAYIQQVGTSLNTLIQNKASVSDVNSAYATAIKNLQSLHSLTPVQRSDLAGLIKDYGVWAASTIGLSGATVKAAGSISGSFISALKGAKEWTPAVSGDVSTLANSILKTGDSSDATKGARAQLIADLQHAGVNASDAKGLVQSFQGQIDALHGKTVNVGLTTSGSGQIIITGTGLNTRTINTTTGVVHTLGGHTAAAGWHVSGGTPGRDSVPVLAMPGELIVPTSMVRSGAVDHLRGKIPGFASGGVVGKSAGAEAGIGSAEAQWGQLAATAFAQAALTAVQKAATPAPGGIGIGNLSASSGYQAFQKVAAAKGWGAALLADWVNVEMREAGFSLTATNPTSGAYGMAQFIQGASEYAQYGGNSGTYIGQAVAMANYISQRYGTPAAAWAHEQSMNWYGSGLDAVVSRPTVIGVGERGPERVQVTPVTGRSSGTGPITIVIENHGVIASQAEADRWLKDGVDRLARNGSLTYALRHSPSAG